MKALSLTQPWATLIAIGEKKIETRSWSTPHRGTVAIHASKSMPRSVVDYVTLQNGYICQALRKHNLALSALPLGGIIAVADLVDCQSTDYSDIPELPEQAFGDYMPGRYMWKLSNVRPLPHMIPCKGALSLWEVPADVLEQMTATGRISASQLI